MRRILRFGFVALLIVLVGLGLLYVHWENARLRMQVTHLQRRQGALIELRAENSRLRELFALAQVDERRAAGAIHAELLGARERMADMENRAAVLRADAVTAADRLAKNRDPQKGLVRLEFFQNVGVATPSAAFETVVWTAMKRDPEAMAKSLILSEDARATAEQLIAELPPDARARWTPEKLAGLAAIAMAVDVSALQITGEQFADAHHAVVTLRVSGRSETSQFQFELAESGWRLVVPPSLFVPLQKQMGELPPDVLNRRRTP